MFPFFFDYATPSAFQSDRRHAELGLTADARRPVRFCARVKERSFPLRLVLQALGELPYDKWREYDPEDTLRFYALRLHEAGMIKSTPQRIIAEGTDWRFLTEVRRELKA